WIMCVTAPGTAFRDTLLRAENGYILCGFCALLPPEQRSGIHLPPAVCCFSQKDGPCASF
ncbi:MAG: hypothetical protein Q7U74_06660, partial [Saprospiraceae bacterium]|nr:hypothetical protein [Saprospiraceae bacterium]